MIVPLKLCLSIIPILHESNSLSHLLHSIHYIWCLNNDMVLPFILRKFLVHQFNALRSLFPKQILTRNKELKDRYKGETCYILGSGPSIKSQDLKRLKGKYVITQNNFHVHPDIELLNPVAHCIVPKYQSKEYDEDWVEWFQTMNDKLPDRTIYFMATNTKSIVDQFPDIAAKTYFLETGFNPLFLKNARVDITRRMMNIPTAITQCLTLALYMGFDKIYLSGMDLDQICRMGERDAVRFYGNSPITKNDAEKSIEVRQYSSGIAYFNRWNTWIQLNLLRNWAEKRNKEIINVTNGGLLDIFEFDNFERVSEESN